MTDYNSTNVDIFKIIDNISKIIQDTNVDICVCERELICNCVNNCICDSDNYHIIPNHSSHKLTSFR